MDFYRFLLISIDFYGFSRISTDFRRFPFIFICFNWFQLISIDFQWISIHFNGCTMDLQGTSNAFNGCSMDVQWMFNGGLMDFNGFRLIFNGFNIFQLISTDFKECSMDWIALIIFASHARTPTTMHEKRNPSRLRRLGKYRRSDPRCWPSRCP